MQLEHSFTVPVSVDEAWRILLDIERIGPCMPGAVIESVDGDNFTGSVKVKLGPINLTYKGRASFVEKDETAHRAVIDARGRDARGNGTANAKVTATLAEVGGTTTVSVLTDLDITGKPAQFGRGVMVDVGNKLIGQFSNCLATTIAAGDGLSDALEPSPSAPSSPAPAAAAVETTPIADAAAQAVAATPGYSAPTVDDPPAPEQEPLVPAPAEDATPSYSAPGGIPDAPIVALREAAGALRGVPADVAPAAAEEPSMTRPPNRPAPVPGAEVEPIDLLQSAGPAVAKRLAPVALALVVLLIGVRRRRARKAPVT